MDTTYTVVPVSAAALGFILRYLWQRGQRELKDLKISAAGALTMAMASAAMPGAVSGVAMANGIPVMAAGITPEGEEGVTWFLATDEFDAHAKAMTKMLRRYTKEYPGPVSIYSTLPHPDAARWFRVLGYERDRAWTGRTPSGRPMARFRRK